MTDKEKKYLSDVSVSINHIISFTKEVKSFGAYKKNFLVKGAVERHLAIIGEAINKFQKRINDQSLIKREADNKFEKSINSCL